MNAQALMLGPTRHGWAVYLTDGRELARFTGPAARRRALRYIAHLKREEEPPGPVILGWEDWPWGGAANGG
jgi:hypothetical protein